IHVSTASQRASCRTTIPTLAPTPSGHLSRFSSTKGSWTRRGVGSFVSEVPATECDGGWRGRRATAPGARRDDPGTANTGRPRQPARAGAWWNDRRAPVTEVWAYMQSAYCRSCGDDVGGVTRGWVAAEDHYDSHVSWGGHDELEHDVVVT